MAITTLDGVLAGMQPITTLFKPSQTTVAGTALSSWYVTGGFPSAGTGPASTASALLSSADNGALPFTNPTGGRLSYLAMLEATAAQGGRLVIYDRQAHFGFAANAVATVSMVSPVTVSGQRSGAGELWLELPTARSASAAALTVVYTNQAGVAARSTGAVSIGTSLPANSMVRLPFQSGDTGALSITSAQITTNALCASGTANIVILRQLASVVVTSANIGQAKEIIAMGAPRIYDSSCLAFMFFPATTTSGDLHAQIGVTQG